MRINQYLASCGKGSRRHCESYILQHRVSVNGQIIDTLSIQIDSSKDLVELDGKQVTLAPNLVYYCLNKPTGFITSTKDPHNEHIIQHLYQNKIPERVYPVGRLDRDSEGLVLLTNDGILTQHLLHPKFEIDRVYLVTASPIFSENHLQLLRQGMMLEEGHTGSIQAAIQNREKDRTVVRVVLRQGWKRQIRRMFQQLEFRVLTLQRIQFGPIFLNNLPLGTLRILNSREIQLLESLKKDY